MVVEQALLLVEWDPVDDHEVGFQGPSAFPRWKQLLHRSSAPSPVVEQVARP